MRRRPCRAIGLLCCTDFRCRPVRGAPPPLLTGGALGLLPLEPFERRNEATDVVAPAVVADVERVSPGERDEALGQLIRGRHLGLLDQSRDQPNAAIEGGFDLEADEILWIVEPPTTPPVANLHPLSPDDCNESVAGAHGVLDRLGEVHARLDRVDVHEDVFLAEALGELVVEATGVTGRLLATVVDEDAQV